MAREIYMGRCSQPAFALALRKAPQLRISVERDEVVMRMAVGVVVGAGVHCPERGLARRHQPTFHVIIGVLIGVQPVRRGSMGQWLEVSEVKPLVQRGKLGKRARGAARAIEEEETKRRGVSQRQPATGGALACWVTAWFVTNTETRRTAGPVR
jgi:hypothetical protein